MWPCRCAQLLRADGRFRRAAGAPVQQGHAGGVLALGQRDRPEYAVTEGDLDVVPLPIRMSTASGLLLLDREPVGVGPSATRYAVSPPRCAAGPVCRTCPGRRRGLREHGPLTRWYGYFTWLAPPPSNSLSRLTTRFLPASRDRAGPVTANCLGTCCPGCSRPPESAPPGRADNPRAGRRLSVIWQPERFRAPLVRVCDMAAPSPPEDDAPRSPTIAGRLPQTHPGGTCRSRSTKRRSRRLQFTGEPRPKPEGASARAC